MFKRVMSGAIGLPVMIAAVALGGWWLKAALIALSAVGQYELYKAFSGKINPGHWFGFAFGAAYISLTGWVTAPPAFTALICVFVALSLSSPVLFWGMVTPNDAACTVLGFFYIPVMFSTLLLTRGLNPLGSYAVWLVFIAAWGCDTGAYFTGITIGRHPLAPKLSPKKTVEGLIGGVALATLLAASYGGVISGASALAGFNVTLFCALAGFFGAILAQLGDLAASAIKRATGVKDFGSAIPGHGGVLDRFDSILFTAPAVYIVLILFQVGQ
ncbi:MAG: phosphatidate cytidylyltransferase [Clostridiales bacterium]|jgi:phosphatidate cytidylyltransferase|nr:phosphatidate cytidylyltransferase [Clostridiales bacterium]